MERRAYVLAGFALAACRIASGAGAEGSTAMPHTVGVANPAEDGLAVSSHSVVRGEGEICAASGATAQGSGVSIPMPTRVPGIRRAVQLVAGAGYSAALLDDGSVWAWGRLGPERSGVGRTQGFARGCAEPRRLQLTGVKQLVGTADHMLALLGDGTVAILAGKRRSGGLDDATGEARFEPATMTSLHGIVQVAAARGRSYAVQQDGRIWQWGEGLGPLPRPVQGLLGRAVSVTVGDQGRVTAQLIQRYVPGHVDRIEERPLQMRLDGPVAIPDVATAGSSGRLPSWDTPRRHELTMNQALPAR